MGDPIPQIQILHLWYCCIDSATHPSLAALAATEDALIAYRAGDLQRVIDRSSAGEHLAREVEAEHLVGRCLEVRARALTDRAEWSTARRTYEEARSTYEAIDDAMRVATCDLGLGWVACSEGALDLADQHIRSGLTTFERLGNREQMGTAHNMLGEAARARGAVDVVRHCVRRSARARAGRRLAYVLARAWAFGV